MVATILSGKDLAAEVRGDLKRKVEEIKNNDPNFQPGLVIVQVTTHTFPVYRVTYWVQQVYLWHII